MPHSIHSDSEPAVSLKLFVILSKAYKSVMEQAVRDMRSHGLSTSEFAVLEALYNKGRIPLQQIGEKILVTSGSVTYNIDKLEHKGLLRRVLSEADRRVIYAELTEAGQELFDRIFPEHAAVVHASMQALSREEKETAMELLKKLGKGTKI